MDRIPFTQELLDPSRTTTFLDSCAFDPKYEPETTAAQHMLSLYQDQKIALIIAHSVESEIDHPNTPAAIKTLANDMNRTRNAPLTKSEQERLANIQTFFIGSGKVDKYQADAIHIFEAGKWCAYFVTVDHRILKHRVELQKLSGGVILRPSEWIDLYTRTRM